MKQSNMEFYKNQKQKENKENMKFCIKYKCKDCPHRKNVNCKEK